MKKVEYIKRYGEKAYEKRLEAHRQWWAANHDSQLERVKQWSAANPEKVKARNREASCKGGKRYEQRKQYRMTEIQHKKDTIRRKHSRRWSPYKQIIASNSEVHHEWLPETANYTGVALVEKNAHRHGFIDVIQIMEGEITLLTEAGVRNG